MITECMNIIFENDDLIDFNFDSDKRLITRPQIYRVNNDILFRLNNDTKVEIYTNQM